MDEDNNVTTRLLTLLNVSALKSTKRKRVDDAQPRPSDKLNKRRSVQFTDEQTESEKENEPETMVVDTTEEAVVIEEVPELQAEDEDDAQDPYEAHFGKTPDVLTESSKSAAERMAWKSNRLKHGNLGSVLECTPEGSQSEARTPKISVLERLKTPFVARQNMGSRDIKSLQNDLLALLGSNRDLYHTRTPLEFQTPMREAIMLHALNHITKKRRRVLKNNERLSNATKSGSAAPEDVQDQGFTRPSVLILAPFRSFALKWIEALTSHTPKPSFQVENHSRFMSEYGLPPGSVDKLAEAEPGTYPKDHVEMFRGNVDDSFRLGVKLTRKSVKLFSDFYGCDLIIASPLGLRMSIEKEKNADFLSSIEILVVDQMDALTMQNWDHVQFVMSHLNQLPKESHDTDFSRIKPWYLDGNASYLRQSVLLSAYETPETRSLFNKSLKNVAGKVRTERTWSPVEVPEGVDQNFAQFECSNPKDELDKRFNYFTTQVMPAILKSAVQSANTMVFVPSSFDFIRVQNYFRKEAGVSFAVLSEYSSNQDISRARQAFFSGAKAFLLVSERFHFFRRYKIRGIRNILFYGPPDHAQFYTEFLSYPFLDEGVEASDVTCRVLYSKYDWMRLERIAGTEEAAVLINKDQ